MHPYVELATKTINQYVKTKNILPQVTPLSEIFKLQAGVFVSIKKNGQLRGCIGTISPTRKNLCEEIMENAVSASTKDFRFDSIKEEELEYLTISVDVLSRPEDIENLDELDPVKYGVIVTSGYKRGLLLPNLENVETSEQQIEICKSKAQIGNNEKIKLQRFTVTRYS